MKKLSLHKCLLLILALSSLPLVQGCDDEEDDGYSGTRTPNAWAVAGLRGLPTLFGGAGASGAGTGNGTGTGAGGGSGTTP